MMNDNRHRIEVVDAMDRSNDEFFYGPGVGQAKRDALVEQARAKLTMEEFDAVCDKGAADERGY